MVKVVSQKNGIVDDDASEWKSENDENDPCCCSGARSTELSMAVIAAAAAAVHERSVIDRTIDDKSIDGEVTRTRGACLDGFFSRVDVEACKGEGTIVRLESEEK